MECSDLVTTLKGNALIQSPDAPSQQPTVPDGASQTHTPSQGGTRLELPPHVANSFLTVCILYGLKMHVARLFVESVARLLNRGQPLLRQHFVLIKGLIDLFDT